jgi:nuclear migration protein JNM1
MQTGTARSVSTSSDYRDFEEEEDSSTHISRTRLHPDEARAQFSSAQVDARNVDFSDRVDGKRKSYRASSRRQRIDGKGGEELGDFSDEDDGDGEEGLERKMARLRREIEEVRGEVERRNWERENGEGKARSEKFVSEEDTTELGKLLEGISIGHEGVGSNPGIRLAKALEADIQTPGPAAAGQAPGQKIGDTATYTVTYAPNYQQSHALAKAADFDTRLTLLEKALGINSTPIPALDSKGTPIAIIPTLDVLQRQMTLLAESTPASLENMGRRVRQLTQEAERLEDARKAARVAAEELQAAGGDVKTDSGEGIENPEQVAKINALYGTLSTIENLAPLLPALLDRLKSLRSIHADAATASESIDRALKKQEDMGTEIKRWREGLEKVEEAMRGNEKTTVTNLEVVEGWVKELEARLETLGA